MVRRNDVEVKLDMINERACVCVLRSSKESQAIVPDVPDKRSCYLNMDGLHRWYQITIDDYFIPLLRTSVHKRLVVTCSENTLMLVLWTENFLVRFL